MGWSRGGIKRTAADEWFSKAVRLAQDHICERCYKAANQVAHVKGRRCNATRYSVDNALAFCNDCHRWQESEPLEFNDWFESRFPGRKDRIYLKARGTLKNNADTRKLVSAHYRAEYRRMEATGDRRLESWN